MDRHIKRKNAAVSPPRNVTLMAFTDPPVGNSTPSFRKLAGVGFQKDVIPIMPADAAISPTSKVRPEDRGKVPGKLLKKGTWVGYGDWPNLETTSGNVRTWDKWPGVGIGVRTGVVVGVDIDVTDEALSLAIEQKARAIFGTAPCRIGNPPKRLLPYRTTVPRGKIRNEFVHFDTGEAHAIEILGTGQQFVSYGIHPKTNKPYSWEGGDLIELGLDGLTEVSPDQVDEFLEAAREIMADAGYEVGDNSQTDSGSVGRRTLISNPSMSGDPEAVRKALEVIPNDNVNYDDWFKHCCAIKAALGGDEQHYQIFEDWCLQWPDNTPEIVRTKWESIYDTEVGFPNLMSWACQAVRVNGDDIELEEYFKQCGQAHTMQLQSDFIKSLPGVDVDVPAVQDTSLPQEILKPPGLVGEIAAYHNSTAFRKTPLFGTAGGLASISALNANQYALDMPTGLVSLNLYQLVLGATGIGKEHPRRIVKEVLEIADDMAVATNPASDVGLLRKLETLRRALWMQDEFGRHLKFAGGSNGGHQHALITLVMMLYGLAFSRTEAREYADIKQNIESIANPYLSVLGTSTRESVTNAMTSEEVVGGTLNRFIVMNEQHSAPPYRDGENGQLSKKTREAICRLSIRKNMLATDTPQTTCHGKHRYTPIIPTSEAIAALIAYRSEADKKRAQGGAAAHLWARSYENALRVAGCIGLGDSDPSRPVLTLENAQWAITFMRWSTKQAVSLLDHIADSSTERDAMEILVFVRECIGKPVNGPFCTLNREGWVPQSQITRKFQKIEKYKRDQLIRGLVEGGYLERSTDNSSQPGVKSSRFRPLLTDD